MRKTEYIAFRAPKKTVDKIDELRDNDCSVSEVMRAAVDFFYEYHKALAALLQQEHEGD